MNTRIFSLTRSVSVLLMSAAVIAGCTKKKAEESVPATPTEQAPAATQSSDEPQHIKVQHILLGYKGSLPGKKVTRSKEEAEKLADTVLEEAKTQKFDDLVKKYTDDQAPGIYGMSNLGVAPDGEEFPRDQMVPAFGNVGFKLKVGEIGVAKYDPATSPYGYHIIKRLN